MATTTKPYKDEQGINVDINFYRSMICSWLYLTASRLDIMFSVCLCARFQSCPKESHLIVIKHISDILRALLEWACGIRNLTIFHDDLFGCRLCL